MILRSSPTEDQLLTRKAWYQTSIGLQQHLAHTYQDYRMHSAEVSEFAGESIQRVSQSRGSFTRKEFSFIFSPFADLQTSPVGDS